MYNIYVTNANPRTQVKNVDNVEMLCVGITGVRTYALLVYQFPIRNLCPYTDMQR